MCYMQLNKCNAEGCNKEIKQQGLCGMHAQRLWRTGRLDKKKGKYAEINKHKDTRPGYRGYLEANTLDDIKQKARQRGKVWALTPLEAFTLIISSCYYCGFTPKWPENRVGIDRVDNSKGYEIDNCVSCCITCNSAKNDLSETEFKEWVKKIYNHLFNY